MTKSTSSGLTNSALGFSGATHSVPPPVKGLALLVDGLLIPSAPRRLRGRLSAMLPIRLSLISLACLASGPCTGVAGTVKWK